MIEHLPAYNQKPRICFVAHYAYGALASEDNGHIGGIERQNSLMARWLAGKGYGVSMITWDEGQPDALMIDGVQIFKMCRQDAGIKGLRFFYPKWTSFYQAMRRADADIYYYNCGDLGLGQVVIWCRMHGRKCVYSVASDPDCDPELPVLKPLRERVLYKYGLRHVDSIVVQTRRQQQMLREGFGINSTITPMPCEGPGENEDIRPEAARKETAHVLWIGRISKEKRLEWLLDVAEECDEIIFDVVGAANVDSDYASALTKRAASIPNVKMHGRIPHTQMFSCYRCAKVLCCTSVYEGFPNTFLEAWSCGIPVVSTIDPDGVIAKYNLGWTVSKIDELVCTLRESINEPIKWRAASKSAKEYYLKNHRLDSCMEQFTKIFEAINKSDLL